MPIKPDRIYRIMTPLQIAPAQDQSEEYRVQGYATTFGAPYALWECDGVTYYERIDAHALDGADMADVIMQFDHNGRVFARTSNGTLRLTPDAHGLRVDADLSKSPAAREMHEEISAGLVTKMSWSFIVSEDAYDRDAHTRTIQKIKKVFDVSAVSIPANGDTDISARSYFDGVIEAEKAERLLRRKKALSLKIKIETEE
jgi:HK97 family phage prohead protease